MTKKFVKCHNTGLILEVVGRDGRQLVCCWTDEKGVRQVGLYHEQLLSDRFTTQELLATGSDVLGVSPSIHQRGLAMMIDAATREKWSGESEVSSEVLTNVRSFNTMVIGTQTAPDLEDFMLALALAPQANGHRRYGSNPLPSRKDAMREWSAEDIDCTVLWVDLGSFSMSVVGVVEAITEEVSGCRATIKPLVVFYGYSSLFL